MKPKISKPSLNLSVQNKLKKRQDEFIKNFDENTVGLPQKIGLEDLDAIFTKFVREELPPLRSPKIDGEFFNIPFFYMINEKWSEFSKTWEYQDDNKNLLKPYGIIRRTKDKKGTIYSDRFNVPKMDGFTYLKVPTLGNDKTLIGYDEYKVPQASAVDLTFSVTILSKNFLDINTMDEYIYDTFNKLQKYVNHQGNYFPITYLDNSYEEKNEIITSTDYIKNYEFLMKAYLVNPEKFIKIRTIKRTIGTQKFN